MCNLDHYNAVAHVGHCIYPFFFITTENVIYLFASFLFPFLFNYRDIVFRRERAH